MAKVISIFNQKGGVGKTTTSINLSASIAYLGKKVLLIDMDPQGNATSGIGVSKNEEKNIYNVLSGISDIKDNLIETSCKNLDIIGSSNNLAGIEIEYALKSNWQQNLSNIIKNIKENYDYIFLDCPPSLGVLSILSLVASNSIIIPIQTEYYALEGVSELYNTIDMIKNNLNNKLRLEGIVLTMYDKRTNLSNDVYNEVKKHFNKYLYKTFIPRNVRLAEAPSYGLPIIDYDKNSKGAVAYLKLAKEVLGGDENNEF